MAKVGKVTNPKMQSSEGAMKRPHKERDTKAHVLTAREISESRRKAKKK